MSDNELINKFISGESKAVELLIERHKNKVFTYIYFNVHNKDLAEDLFQDTFIKVVKCLQEGRYLDNGRLVSWIIRIAHNLIIDYYRKSKQLVTCSNDNNEVDLFNSARYSEETIEQVMVTNQVFEDIRRLVDELPSDQKEIILLRHYGGLSFKEIAEQTNVSINTALGRMRYAIINMRKLVKQYGINLSFK